MSPFPLLVLLSASWGCREGWTSLRCVRRSLSPRPRIRYPQWPKFHDSPLPPPPYRRDTTTNLSPPEGLFPFIGKRTVKILLLGETVVTDLYKLSISSVLFIPCFSYKIRKTPRINCHRLLKFVLLLTLIFTTNNEKSRGF